MFVLVLGKSIEGFLEYVYVFYCFEIGLQLSEFNVGVVVPGQRFKS